MPDEGYLAGVRAACDAHGVVLIFDEVKTGLTAGYAGPRSGSASRPTLITLAKSIGGGLPLAAFGGKREVMEVVVDGRMAHFGTYNGNPLVMAAAKAVDEICTHEALAEAEAVNVRALRAIDAIIDEYELPDTRSGLGVKGCVTWSTTPVRNYRDYKATDFALAELSWLWGVNRHILTPPGLDEQWLVSLVHTDADMATLVDDFRELRAALRACDDVHRRPVDGGLRARRACDVAGDLRRWTDYVQGPGAVTANDGAHQAGENDIMSIMRRPGGLPRPQVRRHEVVGPEARSVRRGLRGPTSGHLSHMSTRRGGHAG